MTAPLRSMSCQCVSVSHMTVYCLHQMFVFVLQAVRRPRAMYPQGSALEAHNSTVRMLYDHGSVCSQNAVQHTAMHCSA